MKKKHYVLLLLCALLSCKQEREAVPPFNPDYVFDVTGVSQENTIYFKREQFQPSDIYQDHFLVLLPSSYSSDKITVDYRCSKEMVSVYMNPGETTDRKQAVFAYEGRDITACIPVFVEPGKALTVRANGGNYDYTLNGRDTTVTLSVTNWGTSKEPGHPDGSRVTFRNKQSGDSLHVKVQSVLPPQADGFTKVTLPVPHAMEAGEYEIVLHRWCKSTVVSDPLMLKYGPIGAIEDSWPPIATDTNRVVSIRGYNFTTDHRYELTLRSDFGVSVRFPLTRKSTLLLQGDLPASLPKGNYEKQLLIDEKVFPLTNFTKTDNIIIVQSTATQPRLVSLSDESQKYGKDYAHFKPLTAFERGQNILATLAIPNAGDGGVNTIERTLRIKHTTSDQEFILRMNGYFVDFVFTQLLFKIPVSVPLGQYEVYFVSEQKGGKDLVSERYHRIITIR